MSLSRWCRSAICLVGLTVLLVTAPASSAGEVVHKNGMIFTGNPVPLQELPRGVGGTTDPVAGYDLMMVTNDLARYFFRTTRLAGQPKAGEVQRLETFHLQQPLKSRTKQIARLGGYTALDEFDEHGRRSLTLSTGLKVIQGITQLTPEYIRLEALELDWKTGMSTTSLPIEKLDLILHQAIKKKNKDSDERLKIVRFYLQMQQYDLARRELETIKTEFPELAARCEEVSLELVQRNSEMILDELKLRQEAGQFLLARFYAGQFPTKDVSGAIQKDVRDFVAEFDKLKELAEKAKHRLGELQGALTDPEQAKQVAPLRSEIAERLHPDNLGRLDAFLKLMDDPKLAASDKLALALSGWIVGSNGAVTDLQQALNLWRARTIIRDYLRTAVDAAGDRAQALEKLAGIEGIGPKTVAAMLPLIPPFADGVDVVPSQTARVVVGDPADPQSTSYAVMIPPEYHRDRSYPLIVALHGLHRPAENEIEFWAGSAEKPGQAQRHGYIVIAPDYLDENAHAYDYSADSHQAVLAAINDARRRFNIDSDRIYLTGHGAGGDAVFDIAFAHPDLFAGAIPMGGVSEKICKFIWENAKPLPMFILAGELDRGSIVQNSRDIDKMLNKNYDIIYCEYLGAGGTSFYDEIHRLFDWMSRYRRKPYARGGEFSYKLLRASDNQIHWLQIDGLPPKVVQSNWNGEKPGPVRVMTVTGKVTTANVMFVESGAKRHWMALSPEFVDFDKRLTVNVNGQAVSNTFPKPDLGVMLDDFYRRGDRQRLYWAILAL